jgi:hypothetical protein
MAKSKMFYHFFFPSHQLFISFFADFVNVSTCGMLALANSQFVQALEDLRKL